MVTRLAMRGLSWLGLKRTFMSIVRVQDGKIAEAWNNIDFMDMYQQLSVLSLNLK